MDSEFYIGTAEEFVSIADTIRLKSGKTDELIWPNGFKDEINKLTGHADGVRFYDYDGTIVYQYTPNHFAELEAMPDNPTHEGLISQGWNWTLTQAKEYVAQYGSLDIGQMYLTDDNKTRLYIEITSTARMEVPLYWYQSKTEGVEIDWGDGDPLEAYIDAGSKNTTHTYRRPGSYIITLSALDGTYKLGTGSSGMILGNNTGYLHMLKKVELGSGVTISSYAFRNCVNLKSITLPNSITQIETYSFESCRSLKHITIPSGCTNIASYAFHYCTDLESVSFPYGLTTISTNVFQYCYALQGICIPDTVTTISSYASNGCNSIIKLVIPQSVTSIGSFAFYMCNSLREVELYNKNAVGQQAFQSCASLRKVVIHDSCSSLGLSAFSTCYVLEEVSIGNGVTAIGNGCFGTCSSLISLTIPASVTSIGASMFSNDYALSELHLKGTTPPTIGSLTFSTAPADIAIYVPAEAVDTYKAAQYWSARADYIQAESST